MPRQVESEPDKEMDPALSPPKAETSGAISSRN